MATAARPGFAVGLVALVALSAAVASAVALGAGSSHVVGCADSVYGRLGRWRAAPTTVLAGPVGWPYLGTPRAHSFYGPHKGLSVFIKGLLVVQPGRRATVRIPARERSRLSLYYGKNFKPRTQWHGATWFRISDGAARITFRACPRGPSAGWTQFAGGFLARGAQCAVVEVRGAGSSRWLRRRIPLGKGTCD